LAAKLPNGATVSTALDPVASVTAPVTSNGTTGTPKTRPRRRNRRRGTSRTVVRKILLALVLPLTGLAVWQLAATKSGINPLFLPTPAQVVRAFHTWITGKRNVFTWTSGTWLWYLEVSLRRVFLGFAIGSVLGVAVGIITGWYRLAFELVEPTIQAIRPVPITAWLPFATLIFGVRESAAVFLVAAGTFFPVVVNTMSGARQTSTILHRAALMLGTPKRKVLWRVVVPSALPSILTGLRLGMGIAWVMVIVAEMLAVKGGLGFAIWSAYTFQRMDLIICAIITIGACGWLSDFIIVRIGDRLLGWQHGLVERR
jgi:NitT/TauT family transport system permease protein